MTSETKYDSRADTLAHIDRVQTLIQTAINNLSVRAVKHDMSKLEEPEKSTFDACTAKLKAMAYGSDEYKAALAELKPALDHHYAENSHHPEHYVMWRDPVCGKVFRDDEVKVSQCYGTRERPMRLCPVCCANGTIMECTLEPHTGIEGMSLFDVLEMLMDWKAATERMKNGGDIRRSLEINRDRFKLSPQLESILANTIRELGW